MNDKYILNDKGEPVSEPDLMKWGTWFQDSRNTRILTQENIGDARISTVFLGLDHAWDDSTGPLLWETMVFGGPLDEEQDRCGGSREQAEAMHARMVQRVKDLQAASPHASNPKQKE